jgi:general secretion pathway protein J
MRGRSHGFTLVEMLVSVMILAVISLLAYDGLGLVLRARESAQRGFDQTTTPARATALLLQDLLHLRARPTRDALGDTAPAYRAPAGDYLLEFTRGGLPGAPGSAGGLQRIGYVLDREGRLWRATWPVADLGAALDPGEEMLLGQLRDMRVEQLDAAGNWLGAWPPATGRAAASMLPRAVRVTLEFSDGEEFQLLVPGLEAPAPLS